MVNLLDGLSSIFGGFGLNSPESKSENNKKWYDFSFLEDEEEKSAFETAKKEAKSDTGLQLDDNVSSSYSSPLDTAKVKYGLNQTGYYDGDASTIPNQQMIDGVKEFQKDNGLHVDGMLKPKGETITTMNNKMKDFYANKKYEIGTEKGEKEYIKWALKQNEKEKTAALAPKPKPKQKKEDNWFSFKPLNKSAEKKESEYSSNSLLRHPEPEPIKTPAEQLREEKSHEQQSMNLLENRNQKNIDYSKYGSGFSKEFIDEMENDTRFHRAMDKYVNDHEGGYVNIKEDRGKETKYGITKRWYPKEDIKNITKERASAILYRDYWNYGKINTLPDDLVDIVFDNAIVQGQPTAMEHLHDALGLPKGGTIVGKESHKKLQELDHDLIKKRFIKNVQNREDEITEKNPSQKLFQKGWRIRSNHYK